MHVVIGGASGFLGSALADHLRTAGHDVVRLVRRPASSEGTSQWDPATGRIDQVLIDRADAVVNLSGAPISQWPRTANRRREILASRLGATTTLARAVAKAPTPPVLLSGSGMSWYGVDRGTERLDESEGPGQGFLADVSQQWEAAAQPAIDAGARTCFLRTSLVLDASGGVLRLMLPAWRLGGGARLGSGEQRMSLITRDDWVRAVAHLLDHEISGPVNLSMPATVTNAEFTDALADVLHRPTFLVAPAFAVRAVLGGLADDLLGSLDVAPAALEASGFTFEAPDLTTALEVATR